LEKKLIFNALWSPIQFIMAQASDEPQQAANKEHERAKRDEPHIGIEATDAITHMAVHQFCG